MARLIQTDKIIYANSDNQLLNHGEQKITSMFYLLLLDCFWVINCGVLHLLSTKASKSKVLAYVIQVC